VFGGGRAQLHSLLPAADVLIICLPATAETVGLVGEAELSLLPRQAVLVNVGRAQVVDEKALYNALSSNKLCAAGIDVWYNYPPDYDAASCTQPSGYNFAALKNVVMSPHRGGGVGTEDCERLRVQTIGEMLTIAAEDGLSHMPNRWVLERGY